MREMLKMRPKLTVCYCAYNEEKNISLCLDDALENLPKVLKAGEEWEVLVIDNASTDRTPQVVQEYAKKDSRIRLVRHDSNRFYSGSNRTAFAEGRGDYIAVIDGDFQHTVKDIGKFIKLIEDEKVDVAFGWKKERHDSGMRLLFSAGLRFTSRFLIGHRLHDINCGYRMLKHDAAKRVVIQETINSIGPELFLESKRNGYKVGEVVVTHFARTNGTGMHDSVVPILRNTVKFLGYLTRLRSRYGSQPHLQVESK